MKTISYYELLELIKNGAEPKRINVKVCNYPCEYIAEYDGEDFNFYRIADGYLEDENYKYYLNECFIESMMFDKCIEIIEEEQDITKIELDSDGNIIYYENGELHRFNTNKQNKYFANKINKLIDEVNKLKNK